MPSALAVADLGVAARAPAPGAVAISGHGLEPTPSASLLAFRAAQGLRGEEEAEDLLRLAAAGLVGDHGGRASFGALARRWPA